MASDSQGLTRLRHIRLLSFLRGHGYDGAFNTLWYEARDEFSVEHMKLLVTEGLWDDALGYLDGFLPACARSFGAQVFRNFLLMHRHIAGVVAGDRAVLDAILADEWMRHVVYARQPANFQGLEPVMACSVLFLDDVRACMDWEGVRSYATDRLDRLVWLTPEMNRNSLRLPAGHVAPRDLLPVGLGRRYIRRLKWSTFESFDESKEYLATIIDDSLRGGIHVGCYVLQRLWKEGSPDLPIWKVTSRAGSSAVTAKTNADLWVIDPSEGTREIDLNNPPPDNGDDCFETQEEL